MKSRTAPPLPDSAIDRMVLVHAVEMADDVDALLREAWRVLAPGGRLIAVVPALNAEVARWALTVLFGGGLIVFCLKDSWFRSSGAHLIAGVIIGAMIPVAWLVSDRSTALNFVRPFGGLAKSIATESALPIFGLATTVGVPLGAFIAALATHNLAFETFTDRADTRRNLIGAVLMGFGGTLALGGGEKTPRWLKAAAILPLLLLLAAVTPLWVRMLLQQPEWLQRWHRQSLALPLLGPLLQPYMSEAAVHFAAFLIGFLVFSSLHIVLGEQVPKTLAIREPEPVALWIAYPLHISFILLYPLNWLLNQASRGVLKPLRVMTGRQTDILLSPPMTKVSLNSTRQKRRLMAWGRWTGGQVRSRFSGRAILTGSISLTLRVGP